MEEAYYLIPFFDDSVYLNGVPIKSVYESLHPDLIQRNNDRVSILYSGNITDSIPKKFYEHEHETKRILEKYKLPYHIIAYGNDASAKEIITDSYINPEYLASLGVRKVSQGEAKKYYNSSNYEEKVLNLFKEIESGPKDLSKEPDNLKNYELDGYLEGYLDGKEISGKFTGSIKVKKLKKKKR